MRQTRSILRRRRRKKITDQFDLQLTSLMDAMVIILVFLLKSATISTANFSSVPNLEMPLSNSPEVPPDVPHLVITPDAMTFEDNKILEFVQTADAVGDEAGYRFRKEDLDEAGRRIIPLYQALLEVRKNFELLSAKGRKEGEAEEFFGELAVQADKKIQYDTLRRVMYTGASAGFKVFHLLAVRRDQK